VMRAGVLPAGKFLPFALSDRHPSVNVVWCAGGQARTAMRGNAPHVNGEPHTSSIHCRLQKSRDTTIAKDTTDGRRKE
jgi:hypothetical protein